MTSSSPTQGAPVHVLFVDDDEANLTVLEAACWRDFSVLTARSAEAALATMATHTVGVLVTDQRMPGVTGVDLLERVRREHPDTIRILITAYSDLASAIDAINRGQVRRYLRKPWQADELRSELADALDVFHMRRTMHNMERRLAETERLYALGVIAGSIAHELNNPLTALVNNLHFARLAAAAAEKALGQTPEDIPEARAQLSAATGALADAEEGTQRIQEIVRGVELPTRRSTITRTSVDVGEVLRLMLQIVRADMTRTASLVLDVKGVPKILGSRTKLGQILLNLLVNALQALAPRPQEQNRITVRVWEEAGWVAVDVTDNGPGIDLGAYERIFDPFYTTREGGTGLGLAISRKIAEELDGRLDARAAPGGGAVFSLRIPANTG